MDSDSKPLRVLFVDDGEVDRLAFERFIRKNKLPYEYSVAVSVEEGRTLLESHRYDVVLLDYMLGDGTGFDLLDVIGSDTPVIFITGTGDEETAVKAIKSGAVDYLIKDPDGNYLTILPVTVDNAIRTKKLEEEVKRYQSRLEEMVEERTIQLHKANEQLRGEILERKQAEEKLRENEEKYRLLADNTVDCIWLLNINTEFTYINPAIEPMMGFTPEEWIGSTLEDHCDSENFNKILLLVGEELGRPPHDETLTFEASMLNRDNKNVALEIRSRVIYDEKGETVGLQGTTRDITERKQAEKQLQDTLESLRNAVSTTIQVIISTVEARDPYTAGHQIRCADLARAIATEMKLSDDRVEGIRIAGSIHDLGKLSVPAEILSKPTKLTEIEFFLIKEHPEKGYNILKNVESSWPLAEIVYQHHERMDGSGYPRKLKGDEILMEARILAVCDVVESMASHRPYRAALGIDAALKEIEDNRGVLYDADVVDACLRLFHEKGYEFE